MAASLRRAIARLQAFLRPGRHEQEFDEELEAHLEMATADKIRQGLSAKEAYRQARLELGNLTQLREAGRDSRGLPWLGSSWLDLKLGLRMLRRSWGLTLVAGLAMTIVITIAAVAFDVLETFRGTDLPLDEGKRIVALLEWDLKTGEGLPTSAQDLERWRGDLRLLEDIAAFRPVERNLQVTGSIEADRPAEAVSVAEVTASAFQVARVAPELGRPLVAEDERAAADPVLLIGHEVWHARFADDPRILGRQVRLDGTTHTIVGVMPESFGFPLSHRYWTPLRTAPASHTPDARAEDLVVFARLRSGVTMEQAEAELRRVGRLPSAAAERSSGTGLNEETKLRVVPYVTAFTGEVPDWTVGLLVGLVTLLLLPPCVNIAVLVYARTVTRQGEFAARFILGASRSNIVAQLFIEILVLAGGAGLVALAVARWVLRLLLADLEGRGTAVPFWMDFESSPKTVILVGGLAILAAMIAGTLPALQATGRSMQAGLKSLGSQTQPRLGGVWTALIVVQVAISFALLPTAVELTWGTVRSGLLGPGFAADQYLTARLEMGAADEQASARFQQRLEELARVLGNDPGIAAVALSSDVPGDGPWVRVETGEGNAEAALEVGSSRMAQLSQVDDRFFDVFEIPILTGRSFRAGDFEAGRHVAIVNRSFVSAVFGDSAAFGGDNPLGRRIRYRASRDQEPGPDRWLEIVGIAADLQKNSIVQTIYLPMVPETLSAVSLALRLRSDPATAAGTLRSATWDVDPALRLNQIRRLDEIYRQKAMGNYLGAGGLVAAALSVLLLSAAGIYALMSFTVNRRRKEIGIRTALGAQPRSIVIGIFGRALGQVGLGALGGILLALLVGHALPIEEMGGWDVPWVIPVAATFLVAVAFLALLGPARRGLRVEPIEELREG